MPTPPASPLAWRRPTPDGITLSHDGRWKISRRRFSTYRSYDLFERQGRGWRLRDGGPRLALLKRRAERLAYLSNLAATAAGQA